MHLNKTRSGEGVHLHPTFYPLGIDWMVEKKKVYIVIYQNGA